MAANMAVGGLRSVCWRNRLLVAVSVPVLGMPFLQTVKAGSVKVHPRELEIYDDPVNSSQYKPDEEEITVFEEKVSGVRRSVWGWSSRVKEGVAKVRNTFSSAEEKSLEFVELIRTDRQFQIRVGGITAAVLTGAVLAGRGRRPIRRIFYASVLGTTAAAICYPKQAVDITQTNYQRLKVFVNEQWSNYNQKQAEKAAKEKFETSTAATVSEKQENASVEVSKKGEEFESQTENVDVQEKTAEPEVASDSQPKSSFWSNVPFVGQFIGGKTTTSADVSPVEVGEDKKADEAAEKSTKDPVIVQEDSPSQAKEKPEGDIGQSNPEDKDMYSTRS